ncbi:hypothetical protein QBZ16_002366 [Prototheca wickerhamii]|uniref:PCI domain-containing protein n=1 Tax=Prototheca wickerhamii TaxID=3111 RepID=A0AAD9IK68_PROWI|nr:hypothetical protein QBZ16_002366 [Prototheca wickerhamii]
MASKFWGRSDSEDEVTSEEETSSSEEETSSSEEETSSGSESESSDYDSDKPKKGGASRFLMDSSDSDSTEEERRVLKSAKSKAIEQLGVVCQELRNKMHINDWQSIQALFDKLNKQLERTQKATGALGVPRTYVRLLTELEDFLAKTLAEKPKLSPTNNRALMRMKQTVRKHNAQYAEQIAAFRANPVSEESSSSASEAEASASEASGTEEAGAGSGADSEGGKFRNVRTGLITHEVVARKLQEISAARGKSSRADRQEQVEMLEHLARVARGAAQRLEVLVATLVLIFDMNRPTHTPMTRANWARSAGLLFEILDTLEAHPELSLVDAPVEEDEVRTDEDRAAFTGGAAGVAAVRTREPEPGEPVQVWGNLAVFLERLDDEWTGSLKSLDPHAHQYMTRLRDEVVLLALGARIAPRVADARLALATVSLRRLDHVYYKTDAVYEAMRRYAAQQAERAGREGGDEPSEPARDDASSDSGSDESDGSSGSEGGAARARAPRRAGRGKRSQAAIPLPAGFALPADQRALVDELVRTVYRHGNDVQKAQALLDSEQTSQLENRLQVLLNRTTAQLGLAAFRAGLVAEAQACLGELYGTGRVKELLAQGVQGHRFHERSVEQEAVERRRQVPFHLHINLELLESACLISSLLLEVPAMAAARGEHVRVSKPLRRLMDNYDRQTFVGPPENVRDHLMASLRALQRGEWRAAYGAIEKLACWGLVPQREAVLERLRDRYKVEGLRTYLLAYARFYSSLSLAQLRDIFELPERRVHAIVSRVLADESLAGAHDQPSGSVVVKSAEPGRLSALAAAFADHAALLVDLNERALALRTGPGFAGGVYGRGRSSRAMQRDDSNFKQLGSWSFGAGGARRQPVAASQAPGRN